LKALISIIEQNDSRQITPQNLTMKDRKKYTKSTLPQKICERCGRPFLWRKKWEKVWEEVKYCSDRCRQNRAVKPATGNPKP
jgi:hypothetical protein